MQDTLKLVLGLVAGYSLMTFLAKPKMAYQSQFFGFAGPNIQFLPDIPTRTCTPAGYGGPCGSMASYCNPECACGVDCADARAQYCRQYGLGGVCHDQYGSIIGAVEPNQGLFGQPIIDYGGYGTPGFGSYYPGYPSYPNYGYGYNPYNYGYGYNYRYPRRAYAVEYDRKSGHFLYGFQAVTTPVVGRAMPTPGSYDQSIVTPCLTGDC